MHTHGRITRQHTCTASTKGLTWHTRNLPDWDTSPPIDPMHSSIQAQSFEPGPTPLGAICPAWPLWLACALVCVCTCLCMAACSCPCLLTPSYPPSSLPSPPPVSHQLHTPTHAHTCPHPHLQMPSPLSTTVHPHAHLHMPAPWSTHACASSEPFPHYPPCPSSCIHLFGHWTDWDIQYFKLGGGVLQGTSSR